MSLPEPRKYIFNERMSAYFHLNGQIIIIENGVQGTVGKEIERRFLVLEKPTFLIRLDSHEIEQWYAPDMAGLKPPKEVDLSQVHDGVRIRKRNKKWFATMKGEWDGASRVEYEWEIDGMECKEWWPSIVKTRFLWTDSEGMVWEIDVFHGLLDGLVIAEVELPTEDHFLSIPSWVSGEITGEVGWSNYELAQSNYAEVVQSIVDA